MKCPGCSAENQEGAAFCSACGFRMDGSLRQRSCVRCGRSIAWDALLCPWCGHDYRELQYKPVKRVTSDPLWAGISLVFCGILGVFVYGSFMTGYAAQHDIVQFILLLIPAFLSFVSIAGGIAALKRKNWTLAVFGGVCALVTTLIFGLVALAILLGAKDQFEEFSQAAPIVPARTV